MTLDLFLLQLFTGLALGSIYVLLALGLSLIFGLLNIVNFAHGQFFMLGAYVGAFALGLFGNFWLALLAVPLFVGGLGMLAERFLVRPLYGRGIDYPLLLTYGLGLILLDSVRILAGTEGMPFPAPALLSGATDLGLFFFPPYRLFLIVVTALVLLALWLFLEKTPYGLIIRAGALDQEIVQVLGVDVARVWLIVFGVGVALAGLAGVLAAPMPRRLSRDGHPDPGRRLRRHGDRRHGLAPGRRRRRPPRRRHRELHLVLLPADRDAVDLHPHGAGADLPSAGPLRPRRGARLMAAGAQAAGGDGLAGFAPRR